MKKVHLLLITLLICAKGFAQVGATNNGTLQISSGGTMFIVGGFTNNSSGAFVNNGDLYVQGTLTNNQASIAAGNGTLYLNGTASQIVAGTQPMKTYHLNTDNTGGITLNSNLHVSGVHTFTDGIIATSSTPNYLVYEAGSSYTGSGNSSHVNGWVKKFGNTGFIFPVGNGTYLREIEISALSAASEFDARHSGATTNTSNLLSPLVHINPNEYWTLNKITGGTAQVTLNWNQAEIAFPNYLLADIRSAQYASGNWTNTGGTASGTVATSGSITSNALSAFGAMAIGSISFVVPLRFMNISASRKDDYTTIQWKTASEERVSVHEVQRSLSGSSFVTIGQVPARNTQGEQTYQFNDVDNLSGTIYYRIKSIDIDGKVSYSTIVSVRIGSSEIIKLVQNPARENMVLSSSNRQATKYQYQLTSAEGKTVQQGSIGYAGLGVMSIPIKPSITAGTYILQLKDQNQSYTVKVVIE